MTPASTLKINKKLFSMSLLLLDNETNSANDVRVNGEKKPILPRNYYRSCFISEGGIFQSRIQIHTVDTRWQCMYVSRLEVHFGWKKSLSSSGLIKLEAILPNTNISLSAYRLTYVSKANANDDDDGRHVYAGVFMMHHANGKNWYCMTSECIADVIIDVTTVGVVVFFYPKTIS